VTRWAEIKAERASRDPHLEKRAARQRLLLALEHRLYRLRERLRPTP
jgi:hypothetical protein